MNLYDIRKWAVEVSGRYDLIIDGSDFVDAGMDKYIDEGRRFLDEKQNVDRHSYSRVYKEVSVGGWFVSVPNVRAIITAFSSTATSRNEMKRIGYREMADHFTQPITMGNYIEFQYCQPFCIAMVRSPDSADKTALTTETFFDLVIDGPEENAIIFPPYENDVVIEAWGTFYSDKLVNDIDENLWSVRWPQLLVWATLYHVEVDYRNTTGASDWLSQIMARLDLIDKDQTEQISHDIKKVRDF